MGKPTLSCIIGETCDAIFESLSGEYLYPSSSTEEWKNIVRDFQETQDLPQIVGAIDGKHIRIQCPKQSRTLFHNYKGFFSFVSLAICDDRYGLILVSMVGRTMLECQLTPVLNKIQKRGKRNININPQNLAYEALVNFLKKKEHLTSDCHVPEESQKSHTCCQIHHSPIIASAENAESYVLATVALHSYLSLIDNVVYTKCSWYSNEALKNYVNSETASVEWQ